MARQTRPCHQREVEIETLVGARAMAPGVETPAVARTMAFEAALAADNPVAQDKKASVEGTGQAATDYFPVHLLAKFHSSDQVAMERLPVRPLARFHSSDQAPQDKKQRKTRYSQMVTRQPQQICADARAKQLCCPRTQ